MVHPFLGKVEPSSLDGTFLLPDHYSISDSQVPDHLLQEVLDLTSALAALTKEDKQDECIAHAIKLRRAWSEGNYRKFFQLYPDAPKMSGYLMDWFVDRERRKALAVIIKAYVDFGTIGKYRATLTKEVTLPLALLVSVLIIGFSNLS